MNEIEFCGLPGSGKTHLCETLARELRGAGEMVWLRHEIRREGLARRDFGKLANLISRVLPAWRESLFGLPHALEDWIAFSTEHPRFTALLHEWMSDEGLSPLSRETMLRAVCASAHERALARPLHGVHLLDEAFAQRYFTFRGYQGLEQAEDASRYAELMPPPGLLVFVDTDPDTCLTRVRARQGLPLQWSDVPEAQLPDVFRRGRETLAHLAEAVASRSAFPVLRVDGQNEARENAALILNEVRKGRG